MLKIGQKVEIIRGRPIGFFAELWHQPASFQRMTWLAELADGQCTWQMGDWWWSVRVETRICIVKMACWLEKKKEKKMMTWHELVGEKRKEQYKSDNWAQVGLLK